ncbi:MAG TPA: protease HtpX [Bdellovibrionales bacterium]|nr:protease HtpX [Bdellovibrionales bacterium]
MATFRRIAFFIGLNIIVVLTLSFVMSLLGIGSYLDANGINYGSLIAFCLIWGMGGAFISLFLSKKIAKWTMGVEIIDPQTSNADLRDLVQTVHGLARQAGLTTMPEVGYYRSPEVNAFATGPTKNNSLVAVSTGLLSSMDKRSVDGVLGHEVAHIANGDMVTMTLLQGVVNAFVMALARVVAFAIDQFLRGRDENSSGLGGLAYPFTVMALEIVLFIPGSMIVAYFSRMREYRADIGGAKFAGRENMIGALRSLQRLHDVNLQVPEKSGAIAALKIDTNKGGRMALLFSTHPPLEARIARLERQAL